MERSPNLYCRKNIMGILLEFIQYKLAFLRYIFIETLCNKGIL